MSVEAMTAVWTQSESKDSDLLVFLAIANLYNTEHEAAWPTVTTLADMARISTRQVQYSIRRLVELKELSVESQAVKLPNGRKVNAYRILLPIQTRRRRGAESAPIENRGVQSATSRGAISDTHNREVPVKDPLKEQRRSVRRTRSRGPDVEHGPFVRPGHGHRQPHYWCGEFFCISAEKHLKHDQRTHAAGEEMTDADWDAWYREKDLAWGEIDIEAREPKGPMYWLWGRMSDDLAGV